MRLRCSPAVLLGLALSTTAIGAATPQAAIRDTLEQRFADIKIESVAPAPWPQMYEVVTSTGIVYSSADGGLLFAGKIIDTAAKKDLTAARVAELQSVDFKTWPLELAIKTVKGNGSRRLVVFADPDCPFCRKLEQSLADVTDVTVYTFLLPIEELHPKAAARARSIWCAGDRSAAWTKWVLERVEPAAAAAACQDDPLSTLAALGTKLKITGTPTLFFEDGHRVSGAISAPDLEDHFGGRAVAVAVR